MHKRLLPLTLLACLLATALPPLAGASSGSLYDEYLTSGSIAGCEHSEADLQAALTSVPADIQAYDPGFPQALNSALDRRAGGCSAAGPGNADPTQKGGTVLALDGAPGPSTATGVPLRPLPEVSDPSDFYVVAIFLVIVLAALLAAAVVLPLRRRGRAKPR